MSEQKFKASLSRSKGRSSWCVIFRHPLRAANNGRPGLRVRRGLGTSDQDEAQRLVEQLNEILRDESMWTPAAQEMAARRYDKTIVAAFYDNLSPALRDSRLTREAHIPVPGQDDNYICILFLGTTGAGKTTVVRQLIGTDPFTERFPSTSASKTTVCDIEVILAKGPFQAVVTFLPKEKARQFIEECVTAAVLAHVEGAPSEYVTKKLLEHTDQRFRLSYILGSLQSLSQTDSKEDELSDDEEDDDLTAEEVGISDQDRAELVRRLRNYISKIQSLAETSKDELTKDLDVSLDEALKDWDVFQELLEYQLIEQEAFHQLVDEILDDIESRFNLLQTGQIQGAHDGWPSHWTFDATDRNEFIATISKFSSNSALDFGQLLTPLVDGIRVSGPFKPEWWEYQEDPRFVLMDGEGLGHTSESVSSISTGTTKRYQEVDVILLVDNAAQPMQAAPSAVLRNLVSSGHESKLVICFTHFDEVKGDNLPNTASKKSHVLSSLDGAIGGVGKVLGRGAENALKKFTSDRAFFLSNIQEPLKPKARLTRSEFNKMLECIVLTAAPSTPSEATPIYDVANLVLSVQKALQDFHQPWKARLGIESHPDISRQHWARIKALSRRLGVLGEDEYDTLRPVADMIARLSEHISMFLSKPLRWEPANVTDDNCREAIDLVEREVFNLLHKLVSDQLFMNRVKEWNHAYAAHRGPGSTIHRAWDIRNIYDSAAPIPGETPTPDSNQFLSEIRQLVKGAIKTGGGKLFSE